MVDVHRIGSRSFLVVMVLGTEGAHQEREVHADNSVCLTRYSIIFVAVHGLKGHPKHTPEDSRQIDNKTRAFRQAFAGVLWLLAPRLDSLLAGICQSAAAQL